MLPTHFKKTFGGFPDKCDDSKIVIFGIPRYISNSIIKPIVDPVNLLRLYSYDIEDYSSFFKVFYSDIKACDIGDILTTNIEDISLDISTIINFAISRGKKVLMIGGDHLFTYFTVKYLHPDILVIMDAHLDLREEYFGKFNNATFVRRIVNEKLVKKIFFLGSRSYSKEEFEFISRRNDIVVSENINDVLNLCSESKYKVYLSIDLDVLEPVYMKLISNPEPSGLTLSQVLKYIHQLSDLSLIGIDVMEFTPYTIDIPSIVTTAKIIFEGLAALNRSRDL